MINYLELAKEQFLNLKEALLDLDRKCLGGIDTTNYEIEGIKFSIEVDGFWEKSTWFDYVVKNEFGNILEEADYSF